MLNLDLAALAQDLPGPQDRSEQEFHQLWCELVYTAESNFLMAVLGGMLADRFAHIFSAGYQPALRDIFPQASFAGWSAFAVSEDRGATDPLPGVSYSGDISSGFKLNGYKTWVAASACCSSIVASARGSQGTLYFDVGLDGSGIEVETKVPGRVLPDLSQGRAHFENCPVGKPLDADRVKSFASAEVFYIYTAFLASTWANYAQRRAQVEPLVEAAARLAERSLPGWDEGQLELDRGVQELVTQMRQEEGEQDALWRRDYKLIALYSKQSASQSG